MVVRKAQKRDVDSCLRLARQEKEKYWKKDDFFDSLKNKNTIFLVFEENKKILGYIVGYVVPTKTSEVMVHETRVNPKYRKKGIGTKLVDSFCREAFKRKVKMVYALIEPPLKQFYVDSCNFKKSGQWLEVSKTQE